jgi:hypothetical protein
MILNKNLDADAKILRGKGEHSSRSLRLCGEFWPDSNREGTKDAKKRKGL